MGTKSNVRSPRRGQCPKLRAVACGLTAAVALMIAAPPGALAQGERDAQSAIEEGLYSCGKARGPVSVSFKPEVELKDLITWAMGFTCKNFVYGSGIGGRSAKVTIIAPKKMTAEQAWRVFLVALETMNLTVVPKGNVLSIIESSQAKTAPLPLYRKGGPAPTAQLVRMIMRPEHVPVDELSTAINAIKSKDGTVTVMPKVGILVVTDYGDVISKMRALVAEIDQPIMGERLYMIRVRNADATEIASKLQEILGTKEASQPTPAPSNRRPRRRGRGAPEPAPQAETSEAEVETAVPSKILADERTNSVIVLASEPAYLRVRALIKRMDLPLDVDGAGRIHVHALENADAEQMAQTLTAVISGVTQTPATTGRSGGRASRARQQTAAPSGDAGAPAFEGQVRVTHDKPTNSLVIVASVKDYLSLRDVVRRLDVPRRQVFIEAVILEVKADNSRDFGFSYHGGKDLDNGALALGGLQHSNLSSLNVASLASSTGLLGGVIGPLLENADQLLGASLPSFGVLFQALATANNVNVLSSPHILTTDNEEAEISVGENIPYQSSFSNFGAGGTGGGFGFPVQSVQRQDVALTLKITPHVNASNMVSLDIDQEISDIASPNFEGLGPSWAKRTIKTTVVVRDQQSIVIGGLMSDRVVYSESKIPLLGDVPLLGHLFKYTTKNKAKTNLLVLLTPYIINDQLDIEQIVQRKVRERAEFVRSFSTFQTMEFRSGIDYRRKRGVVEEINRTVKAIEEEIALRQELERTRVEFPDGPIEYEEEPVEVPTEGATEDAVQPDPEPTVPATQPSGAAPAPATGQPTQAAKPAQPARAAGAAATAGAERGRAPGAE